MKKRTSLCLFLMAFTGILKAQVQEPPSLEPPFLKYQHHTWVDSIMEKLTPDERIAQLIMVAAYSNKEESHKEEILQLIREQKIGGLIFFQGGPVRQARLMNVYQAASQVPLLGAIDAEWGLGMRLDSTISYPFQMALGAIQEESLIYEMGVEIAEQIKRSGLHVNFAPVLDVNNNPNNPVINYRSFGEDKYNVTRKSIAYMRGMQEQSLLPTAKHFPGHGDTDTDSHYALPQINHSRARLDSLELYPFSEVVKAGIGGVMVAHLDIPALDSTGLPSTLSKPIITQLLKEELGFKGITVTDAMNMKGVTDGNSPGIVDKDAILAGNDLLEFTEDVPKAIEEIRRAISQGLISQAEIDRRCRKILAVKYWVGLHEFEPTSLVDITENLNTPEAHLLNRKLVEASLTVLRNEQDLLPVKQLEGKNIASISIGLEGMSDFQRSLSLYTQVEHFNLKNEASREGIKKLKDQLKAYDFVIVGIHDESKFPRNTVKMNDEVQQFLKKLISEKTTVVSLFKNPYTLGKIENIENASALIVTYQDTEYTEDLAAQLIFGGVGARGKLPVSVGNKFKVGDGLDVRGGIRFEYTSPEEVGMDSGFLNSQIDSLMQQAIMAKAIPGGQLLIAKDQKVIFHKAYGYHSYSDTVKVKLTDLYDLASVTKITSALPALMKLYDEGEFDLSAGIETYLPQFRRSNKSGIPFREILAHQAGFEPWIPYWRNTLRKNGSYRWNTFKQDSSARFPVKVAEDMWLHRNYKNKIYTAIKKSPLESERKYLYSGLAFYLLPEIVEKISGEDYISYINNNFYRPMGATSLTYRPLEKFKPDQIVPTENDFLFRKRPIHGVVHDEGAIMMGGISANAGLFSNSNDLAKLLQMYLNKGNYGGQQYISPQTIEEFTRYQFPENENRRGLGFDKPSFGERDQNSNAARDASDASYGHTGFTGIMVWVDPEYELLYIFLSNRVSPTRENTRLYNLNTRTSIQQVLYGAIK